MSYYPELDSYIRYKSKVALDFSNYATKKESDRAAEVDTDLAAKKYFNVLKVEVDKLVNVPPNLNLLMFQLQPWTKLVETKVKNPVNSRND